MRFKAARIHHPIRDRGFTLIELMIAVAIVGILSAIAYPSYTQYLVRGKLTEATATLAGHRVKMEQFFQDNRTYTGACAAGTGATEPADTENFNYTCTIPDAQTYTISAAGLGGLAPVVLSIDQSNTRRTVTPPPGWTAPAGNCWVRKKSGQC
ncbi:MAG: type IV pilin protein [Betaproteobacteria bacterium]